VMRCAWCSPQEWCRFRATMAPWTYSTIHSSWDPSCWSYGTIASDGSTLGPESMEVGGVDERHCRTALVTPTGALNMPAWV
jgi:hypothetical protein